MKSKTKAVTDATGDTGTGTTTKTVKKSSAPSRAQVMAQVSRGRNLVAQVVWLISVVAALVLAIAALLIAVKASTGNDLVKFVLDRADDLAFNIFSLDHPIKRFHGSPDSVRIKNALLNYGVGAVVYLVAGRILERIIKP